MKTKTVNLILNISLYMGGLFLVGTGLLLQWRLPPGSGRLRSVLGWTRHDWGTVHFWLAVFVVAAVILHLAMHWRWIWRVAAVRKRRWIILAALGTAGILATFSRLPVRDEPLERLEPERRGWTADEREHRGPAPGRAGGRDA